MSSRDIILQQRALAGLMRSHSSQVNSIQNRVSRWPGAAQSIFLEPGTTFVPGTNFTRTWHDVADITVLRGRWMIVAEATILSRYISGYEFFWASLRLNGSDDASAEERTRHTGAYDGLQTDLTSFSSFYTANASATLTLQVSQCTNRPSLPDPAFYPSLVNCTIFARPN